jgi:hypothetical protein
MIGEHSVQTCRWGEATLLLPRPHWFEASQHAWSCTREGRPKTLVDPSECEACERWARRETHAGSPGRA